MKKNTLTLLTVFVVALLQGSQNLSFAMEGRQAQEETSSKKNPLLSSLKGIQQDVRIRSKSESIVLPYPLYPWKKEHTEHTLFVEEGAYYFFDTSNYEACILYPLCPCVGIVAYNHLEGKAAAIHMGVEHDLTSLTSLLSKDFPSKEDVLIKLYTSLDQPIWKEHHFDTKTGIKMQIGFSMQVVKALQEASFSNITLETYTTPITRSNLPLDNYRISACETVVFSCKNPLGADGSITFFTLAPFYEDILGLSTTSPATLLEEYASILDARSVCTLETARVKEKNLRDLFSEAPFAGKVFIESVLAPMYVRIVPHRGDVIQRKSLLQYKQENPSGHEKISQQSELSPFSLPLLRSDLTKQVPK